MQKSNGGARKMHGAPSRELRRAAARDPPVHTIKRYRQHRPMRAYSLGGGARKMHGAPTRALRRAGAGTRPYTPSNDIASTGQCGHIHWAGSQGRAGRDAKIYASAGAMPPPGRTQGPPLQGNDPSPRRGGYKARPYRFVEEPARTHPRTRNRRIQAPPTSPAGNPVRSPG